MNMWEEAPKTEIFGMQVYSFGLYCAIGALCAAAAICLLCRAEKTKKGTGFLLSFLSFLFGAAFARIAFCILGSMDTGVLPFRYWFSVSTGGWSLFAMIFGVFAGTWVCSVITGENRRILLDTVSCSLPLMIAAERYSEKMFELFDISRTLSGDGFPANTFLAVRDPYYDDVSYLATYLVAAIAALILFLILVFFLTRGRKEGDLWILFMLLCGAGGILLESLRYDHFMEFSFVRFEQVMAAGLLCWGVLSAAAQNRTRKILRISAFISLPAAIGALIGIEFALDRSSLEHYILYAVMLAVLAVPVTLGVLLLRKREKEAA